jgi:hypothetical protein
MLAVGCSYRDDAKTQEMKFFGPLGASPCAVTYAAESPPSTMKSYLSVKHSHEICYRCGDIRTLIAGQKDSSVSLFNGLT